MAFNMPAPFQKVGIRQRLYIAVGAIASFALVSAAAGWFALSRLDSAITVVTDEGVPTVIAALNLAERVADIAGVAPDLVTAQDEKEIQQLVAGIQQKEENIQKALDVISATMSGEGVETIEKETKTLLSSIGQLRQVVDARVRTTQFRIEETQKLTTIHGQFLQIAAPMVDDAVFELTSSMTSATSSGDMNKVSEALGKLANTELLMLQGITNLIAEVNNTVGLLAVGAQAANMDELQTISRRYELSAGKVERGLEFIEKVKSNKDLAKAAVAVLDFGSPGIGVISLREQELSALEQGRQSEVGGPVDHQAERAFGRMFANVDDGASKIRIRHAGHGDQELIREIEIGAFAHSRIVIVTERGQISTISKSSLRAPHSGHTQFGGTSSHLVPGGMPSSGNPAASS